MGFGKLHTYKKAPRAIGILALSKHMGLEIEVVETAHHLDGVPELYLNINPLGKTPTFVGADGLVLTECMAIMLYVASQDPGSTLLGPTQLDFIQIIKWMSLTNTDLVSRMAAWVRPLVGYMPYTKDGVIVAQEGTARAISIFENHLKDRKYLVADRLTLADIMCAGLVTFGFAKIFDREWRAKFPHFTGWFNMVMDLPMYRAVLPHPIMIEKGLPNVPPKQDFSASQLAIQRRGETV